MLHTTEAVAREWRVDGLAEAEGDVGVTVGKEEKMKTDGEKRDKLLFS